MKTHLNLHVRDLDRAVGFYRLLLDAQPVKHHADYALFLIDDPALELALDLDQTAAPSNDAHYGIVVDSVAAVDATIACLNAAGVPIDIEREAACCYAVQTKVWAVDPDGRRWETYTVHEEIDERDDVGTACCVPAGAVAVSSCC